MSAQPEANRAGESAPDDGVLVKMQGTHVVISRPGIPEVRMPISTFIKKIAPEKRGTDGVVLPDGVKSVVNEGDLDIWVYECPPRVHSLLWIAKDSPEMSGLGAKYRTVRLALPYVIVLAVFIARGRGQMVLSNNNEVYFRTEPLKSLNDGLYFPALLNCAKSNSADSRPLSWLCTQNMEIPNEARSSDKNVSMRAYFRGLLHCLFETGFNLSFEQHNMRSWYTISSQIDPRLRSVEEWEEATRRDPLFVLDVPWIPVGLTVQEACKRIYKMFHGSARQYRTARDVALAVVAESIVSSMGLSGPVRDRMGDYLDGPF
ncbi:MAG: hypothetical protein GX456_18820 [Verrucomicrobia bacterium]|nr:hypothetical protein [Verrucomicrobiota bacterium]